jgi:hypothetical protein
VDHTLITDAVTMRRNLTVKMGIELQKSNLRSVILLTVLLGVRSETREINIALGIPAPESYCMTFCLDTVACRPASK